MECFSQGAVRPGQDHHDEPIQPSESRALHTATKDDDLLTEKGVLGQELRSAAHQVASRTSGGVAVVRVGLNRRLTICPRLRAQSTMPFFMAQTMLAIMVILPSWWTEEDRRDRTACRGEVTGREDGARLGWRVRTTESTGRTTRVATTGGKDGLAEHLRERRVLAGDQREPADDVRPDTQKKNITPGELHGQ